MRWRKIWFEEHGLIDYAFHAMVWVDAKGGFWKQRQFAVTQNMSSEKKDTFCGDAKYGLRSMDYRLRFSCHGLSWRKRWFLETKTQFAVTQNMSSEKKDTFCGDAKYGLRKELTLSGVCHAPARTAQRVGLGQGGDLAPSALFILRTKI